MEQIVNEDTNDADYWRKLAIEQQAEIKRLSLYAKLADEYGLSIFFDCFVDRNEALGVCVGHCDPVLALDAIENLKAAAHTRQRRPAHGLSDLKKAEQREQGKNKMNFEGFGKIARWSRNITITEKIDGTNACIFIGENGEFLTASRTRWITPADDNYGFSKWAHENKDDLLSLGVGKHFGEWWGEGIQRRYDQNKKRFSLFNTSKWSAVRPECCDVVPIIYNGVLDEKAVSSAIEILRTNGSVAAPGFMRPEGIVIWHEAACKYFKKTLEKDEEPKSVAERHGHTTKL